MAGTKFELSCLRCLVLLVSSLILTAGCGPGSNLPGPSGTVTGKATYKGEPIPEGSAVVFVHQKTGIIATGLTDAQGNFNVLMRNGRDILVGDYAINITPPGQPDENISILTMDNVPEEWKKVPQKYWGEPTSGEIFTVVEGKNEYNLELTD